MEIFRLMFAEKILRLHESTNRTIKFMMKMPLIGSHINNDIFSSRNSGLRRFFSVISQIVVFLLEFLKKYVYVAVFIYLPYLFIAKRCPLVELHRERAIIYMFVILTTICGSLANNTMFSMAKRDYLMIKVILVSAYMNCIGRLVYKMLVDFVFFTIILCTFDVSFYHAVMVALVTMAARPIGEMLAIISFDHIKSLYESRNIYNGFIMAASVVIAYGMPLLTRKVSEGWMIVTNPVFVIIMLLLGVGAMLFLWKYKHYRNIMREALHNTKEG